MLKSHFKVITLVALRLNLSYGVLHWMVLHTVIQQIDMVIEEKDCLLQIEKNIEHHVSQYGLMLSGSNSKKPLYIWRGPIRLRGHHNPTLGLHSVCISHVHPEYCCLFTGQRCDYLSSVSQCMQAQ